MKCVCSLLLLAIFQILGTPEGLLADEKESLVALGAKVIKLAGGMKFTEGPVWLDQKKILVFTDCRLATVATRSLKRVGLGPSSFRSMLPAMA